MLRKLLTLLALCAGLAAIAEPARAAVSPVAAARQVAAAGLTCSPAQVPEPATRDGVAVRERKTTKTCPKPTIVVIVPTVMLQADRARE